jgi:CopG family nickel-responsive transcriptional regulator
VVTGPRGGRPKDAAGFPASRAWVGLPVPAGTDGDTIDLRMSSLSRIGVAIDSGLLSQFDALLEQRGYTNRSEAFRDLIRDELVEKAWESPNSQVVGTVTLVYDHHVRMLNEKLTSIQHEHHHSILSTLHVHLDHDNCLEVLVVRGKSAVVRNIADTLIGTKGVKHGRLTITTSGAGLK